MKHIPKHAKRSKAKKYILNTITAVMFCLFFFSMSAIDSESWLPAIAMIVSAGWLGFFAWANGYI